jgi:potassium-transporting ATPase KdpC subunit
MVAHLRRSVLLALVFLVLFGLVYPLVGTAISQVFFKKTADGSLTANGSTLIGQDWTGQGTRYFHGRPDAAGPYVPNAKSTPQCPGGVCGDNPLSTNYPPSSTQIPGFSAATNLGPRSQTLLTNTQALIKWWHSLGVNPTTDLVTTSGSGVDPDITPDDAYAQVPMVSKARGIPASTLNQLIAGQTHGRQVGFLGSPYVVVLTLNEALDHLG